MRDLLRDLYSDTPPLIDVGVFAIKRDYRAHCCKAAFQSNYLLYLEDDVTTEVAYAARFRVGLASGGFHQTGYYTHQCGPKMSTSAVLPQWLHASCVLLYVHCFAPAFHECIGSSLHLKIYESL